MTDSGRGTPSSTPRVSFGLPSLEELERLQAEDDAQGPELFFEPKKRKLAGM